MFGHQAPSQFMNGLRSEVENSLDVDIDAILKSIKKEAKEIEESNTSTIVDAPSHGHLEFCSCVLSAYNNLLPVKSNDERSQQLINADFTFINARHLQRQSRPSKGYF